MGASGGGVFGVVDSHIRKTDDCEPCKWACSLILSVGLPIGSRWLLLGAWSKGLGAGLLKSAVV